MIVDSRALVDDNRAQWTRDLAYRARPLVVPTSVRSTALLAGVRLAGYPTSELRLTLVEPADDTPLECVDGWPVPGPTSDQAPISRA